MGSDAQLLPPKMAEHYAKLAKEGKATRQHGSIYIFERATEEITLICLDPPQGHVTRRRKHD